MGYYNPIVAAEAEPILVLKDDRIRYWLSVGAQPSESAAALLKKQGLLARRVAPAAKAAPAAATTPEVEATPAATEPISETPAESPTAEAIRAE